MPPKRNPIVVIPSRAKKSQPATIRVASKTLAPIFRAVNTNYSRGRYPWDDHQDDVVVNSVEAVHAGGTKSPAGAEHYLQALNQQKEYRHICIHPDEYRRLLETMYDDDAELGDEPDSGSISHPGIDYTRTPHPPDALDDYNSRLYTVQISNPAIFLAAIRIAQHNLPFLDFTSAINHLPNLPLHKKLPKLPKHGFTEDVRHEKRNTDTQMSLAFLPHFYQDGRHALGYFHLVPTACLAYPLAPPILGTCLFTPCTTSDLMHFKLVEWLPGTKYAEVENMNVVGGRHGQWLHPDVVEEWEGWKMVLRVVGRGWQRRLALCSGKEEGGGRRAP